MGYIGLMAAHYDADRYEEFLEHSAIAEGDLVLAPVALLPSKWVRERRLGVQTKLIATVMVLRGSGADRTVVLDVECFPDAVEVAGSHPCLRGHVRPAPILRCVFWGCRECAFKFEFSARALFECKCSGRRLWPQASGLERGLTP